MKKARRFAILRGSSSLSQKPYFSTKSSTTFCPQLFSLDTTLSRSQSSLCLFLVLSFMACALYLATYYTASASSIFRWPAISTFTSHKKSGPFSPSSLGKILIPSDYTNPPDEDYITDGAVTEKNMSCKLPNLDPFHPSIIQFIKEPAKLQCETETWPNVFSATASTLRQVKPFPANATYHCCFKTFTRSMYSDKEIRYSKLCHNIPPWREVKVSEEFVHILCVNSTSSPTSPPAFQDMFAFVPLKPSAASRISSSKVSKQSQGDSSPPPGQQHKLNVVILGLDGQSRMNFLRQMPLTHSYLISNLSAISLQGYTKVSDNTFPNIVPLLTGLTVEQLQRICWPSKDSYFDDCPFIWKNFSAHGYRTSYAEDSVWMGAFNYEKAGFRRPPTDYYLNPFSNYMETELGHHPQGNSKLCYGPRQTFQLLLDYIRNTAAALHDGGIKPYFQFVWAASLFHDYLNVPRLGDSLLFHTLLSLHSQNFLNHTLFILMSDHGARWGDIRKTFQGKIEERMPLVYTIFPPWFHSKYPHLIENLKINSNRLTTPFDLHLLLRDILYFPKSSTTSSRKVQRKSRAYSLFQRIPPSRTCQDAKIAPHWCVCDAMLQLPLNTTFLEPAASFVVKHLNKLLNHVSICAKLQLTRIIQAVQLIQYEDHLNTPPLPQQLNPKKPKSYSRILPKPIKSIPQTTSTPTPIISSSSPSSSINSNTLLHKIPHLLPSKKLTNSSPSISSPSLATRITIQITLQTYPGNALFEATLTGSWRRNTANSSQTFFIHSNSSTGSISQNSGQYTNWKISQTVSRINSYASQSNCVSDYTLQKYCFCQNHSNESRSSHH